MRCGSPRSTVSPAAWWTVRSAGSDSNGAGAGAHDSSGLRWLPRTPAPAILVVLVTGELAAGGAVGADWQPLTSVMPTAIVRPSPAAIGPTRWLKNGTGRRYQCAR